MPRIPQLASATSADSNDELPFEDVSASTTKKITKADYLKDTATYMTAGTINSGALADGAVTAAKIAPQEAWQSATLQNSWVNYDSGFATASYMKDSLGFVHIKGAIKSGTATAGTVLFTLPAGYRPLENSYVPASSTTAGSNGSLQIAPNGNVMIISGSNAFFSLGQIAFKGEQ